MITCAECRSKNDADAAFCDQCGAALSAAVPPSSDGGACPDCGGAVRETGGGKGVCRGCGAELMEQEQVAPVAVAAPAEPPPAPSGEPVPVYTSSSGIGAYAEAALLRSQLEAAGFVCEMFNAQHASMVLGGGLSIGIRLVVPASQAEAARRFLRELRP